MSVDSAVSDVLAMDNDIRVATARGAPEYLGKREKKGIASKTRTIVRIPNQSH